MTTQAKIEKIARKVLAKEECHWIEGAATYMVLSKGDWQQIRLLAKEALKADDE